MQWLCYTSSLILRQSYHSIGTAGLYLYWEDPSPSDVCDASGRPSRCFSLCQGGASRTAKSVLFIQLGPRTYQSPGHMVWASLGTAEGPWQCPNRIFQQLQIFVKRKCKSSGVIVPRLFAPTTVQSQNSVQPCHCTL